MHDPVRFAGLLSSRAETVRGTAGTREKALKKVVPRGDGRTRSLDRRKLGGLIDRHGLIASRQDAGASGHDGRPVADALSAEQIPR